MLDIVLNPPTAVTTSDAVAMFNSLANNPAANAATFAFLDTNWDALAAKYESFSLFINYLAI